MYICVSLSYLVVQQKHDIVNQLYFNFLKKKFSPTLPS